MVLAHLDEVEGVDEGLFARVEVALLGGEAAVAYELGTEPATFVRIAVWDGQAEA